MPRKKAQTLYDHCFKELLDERMQDLKDGKDVTRIGDVAVTQRVVEYAKKAPYVKLPRTRKKKESAATQPQPVQEDAGKMAETPIGTNMVYEKGKLVHG